MKTIYVEGDALRIWNFVSGYVMIRVEGLSLEKFLNVAVGAGVRVYDIRRISYTVLQAGLSARGYSKLLGAVPERYTITAVEKRGVPFGIKWILKRKVLLIGLAAAALAIIAAGQFVWEIRIDGNKQI